MKFSERIGAVSVKEVIQTDSISAELRNALWNVYFLTYLQDFNLDPNYENLTHVRRMFRVLWWQYWNSEIDKLNVAPSFILYYIKDYFFKSNWWEVYDFLEATVKVSDGWKRDALISSLNKILNYHLSGYRFVGDELAPITNDIELVEVQKVLDVSNTDKLNSAKVHIQKALELLSLKPIADYRNSIKESVSAVEAVCKILTNEQNVELGKALTSLTSKVYIHKGLVSGFKSIYGFTSDEGGIRHSLLEESTLDQIDAIYMLVSCSAFVNYLIAKENKSNVNS